MSSNREMVPLVVASMLTVFAYSRTTARLIREAIVVPSGIKEEAIDWKDPSERFVKIAGE